jgi:hypothetical protein
VVASLVLLYYKTAPRNLTSFITTIELILFAFIVLCIARHWLDRHNIYKGHHRYHCMSMLDASCCHDLGGVTKDGGLDWWMYLLAAYTHGSKIQAINSYTANLHNISLLIFTSLPWQWLLTVEILHLHALRFCLHSLPCRLQPPAHAGSSLADFSTLKMEAIRSSETSVHTRSTRRHIPEDDIFHRWLVLPRTSCSVLSILRSCHKHRLYGVRCQDY